MQIFNINRKYFFIIFFIILILVFNYPEEMAVRSIDSILSDIRKEQGLKESDKINPDKVSPELLEELGDSVMEKSIGNHEQHEFMDQMMGGEGSPNLTAMHQRIGFNYLTGNTGWFGNMMGYGGMMGMMYRNKYYDNKGGFPMMWNNGYGMMGWGFGGWIMGFIFLIIIIAVGLVIFFALRNRGNFTGFSKNETPLEILKKRYAKGEITKKEFDEMKKDL